MEVNGQQCQESARIVTTFNSSYSNGGVVIIHHSFICLSLMVNDVEHLPCVFLPSINPVYKMSIHVVFHFLTGLLL